MMNGHRFFSAALAGVIFLASLGCACARAKSEVAGAMKPDHSCCRHEPAVPADSRSHDPAAGCRHCELSVPPAPDSGPVLETGWSCAALADSASSTSAALQGPLGRPFPGAPAPSPSTLLAQSCSFLN